MESGPGSLGSVASEPGKGSFPLPFLLPGRRTGALTEQTRAGAERRGRGCCLLHRFSGAARNPSDPLPRDPLQNSAYSLHTSQHCISPRPSPHRLGLCPGAHAAAQPAPSPLPKSSGLGQPWFNMGQPPLATPVAISCPLTLSPSPGRQPGYSPGPRMGVPLRFRGPSWVQAPGPPRTAPLRTRVPSPLSRSPELLTSLSSMEHRGPR